MDTNTAYIFVVGNEKGGVGKTTCSMHMIVALLEMGLRVASIDIDYRQHSLTRYINNRKNYNINNKSHPVLESVHFLVNGAPDITDSSSERNDYEEGLFNSTLNEAIQNSDVVLIDTPGSYSFLSRLAHSYADTIITPINDSFLDMDVMAKVSPDYKIIEPSIYSQMIWEQKMKRAKRDGKSINWVVMRNRLSNIDATNKRNMKDVLDSLAKRIGFKVSPGFSERVIFRELFLQGLTLLDLKKANYEKTFSLSHVTARQELKNFLNSLRIEEIFAHLNHNKIFSEVL